MEVLESYDSGVGPRKSPVYDKIFLSNAGFACNGTVLNAFTVTTHERERKGKERELSPAEVGNFDLPTIHDFSTSLPSQRV